MDSSSNPPSKSSRRKDIGEAIRHGYDRLKHAIQPSSHSSAQNTGSAAAVSAGANSASPTPYTITTCGQPNTSLQALPQGHSTAEQTTSSGPTTQSANQTFNPVNNGPTSPKPTTVTKFREVGNVALSKLELALRVLEKSAGVFPLLGSAVGGLIDCLDIVLAAAANSKEYEELTAELAMMAGTLNQYLGELGSEDPCGSASRIALSIEAEVAHIVKQQGRNKGRRIFESVQEMEDVIRCYHRIEGLFRQLQSDMVLQIWRNTNKLHVTTLLRGMSPVDDARYNSSYSTTIKRRGCTAETREEIQANLQEWSKDPNAAKVYWMNGMAGTGKTTIAYSLCEWLAVSQQLGASFFCSRTSPLCRNVHLLVPTIAYQLARYSPSFRSALCKVLEQDPDAGKLNVVWQFKKLIQEPMKEVRASIPEGLVVVIDALDECEDVHGVRLVLETLLRLAADLPLKFFVTSRPEPEIRDNMLSPGGYSPSVLHLHDIEQSIVEGDIKKYLVESFSSMSPPPSDEQIQQLAKCAGKLFIYAATAVRYILPGKGSANSAARLNAMLAMDSPLSRKGQSTKKYKELDELYTTILAAAFNGEDLEAEELEATRLVLRTAACAKEPMTALTMASLLDLTEEQVLSALQPFRSVLHVSEVGGLISTLHASFPDYIVDRSRSGDFYCDLAQHSSLLAHRCFDVMKEQLRFNICGLESSFVFDKDIPGLEQRIKKLISPTLFYACQYWGEHLRSAAASDMLCDRLVNFLTHRLLFWMEVLNLNMCAVKGVTVLIQAENWLQVAEITTGAKQHVADARDFVTRFAAGTCTRSTPHIYLSALALCARSSSVYTNYWARTKGLMDIKGTAIGRRDRAAQATWMTDSEVRSLAFSPDGTRIVSGSNDHTIRVWDAHTGDPIAGPFIEHTDVVRSVAFSPEGTRIASGSHDRTIRVWDSRSGDTIVVLFKSHKNWISSVEFSSDGTRLVSSSYDRTVRVWDAHTGNPVAEPFQGHTDIVRSAAFSPDGTRIVSGSNDHTIRVWDARNGDSVAGPFRGHSAAVHSVAFSPDSTRIVSGSHDGTIHVWDAYTGDTVAGPFKGHKGWVSSVVFSPDGTRIGSGSHDQTARVWDARSGKIVAGPFEGHLGMVYCVVFSPDGTRIVSGSYDQTIRVWDARTHETTAIQFDGHTNWISSVVFSPDGTHIISGSHDQTVRVWDARTGDPVVGPFKAHRDLVSTVACSLDGTLIASGSHDGTIHVWDAHTGDTIAGPFKGHRGWVSSVVFSPDGTRILSGSHDSTIQLWSARTGCALTRPFRGHKDAVTSVAFSPDGVHIASGSDDQSIRVWDVRACNVVARPFQGHMASVNSVAFSPDGTRIASGSNDWTVLVWDAYTGNVVVGPFEGHRGRVRSVAFSPDGTCIASGSTDRTIRLWDASTGDAITGSFEGHTDVVNSVAFSPDGARIVSGSDDQTIRVWDARTDSAAGQPQGHTSSASSMSSRAVTSWVSNPSNDHDVFLPQNPMVFVNMVEQCHISNAFMSERDFKSSKDGWFITNHMPLFWISPDFRPYIPHPRNFLVLGPQGTTFIDYQHLLLGERWSECYVAE